MRPQLEVCVDCIGSAKAAIDGGADRLEVCATLSAGGLTPSHGFLQSIRSLSQSIPLFVMIRPRSGDFCYSSMDVEVMIREIEAIKKENLADGFVLGALNPNGSVDTNTCAKLLVAANPFPVTFHRAFDMTVDAVVSLEEIISLGFTRILTSGQHQNAKQGMEVLKMLVSRAKDRIIIMAGSGITDKNVETILRETKVREIHSSASITKKSKMEVAHETVSMGKSTTDDFTWKVAEEKSVKAMNSILKRTVFIFSGPNESPTIKSGFSPSPSPSSSVPSSNGSTPPNGRTSPKLNGTNGH